MRDLAIPTIEGPADSEGAGADEGCADATRATPHIESAIPSELDAESATVRHDRMPRTRVLMVAALAAIALTGGTALWITHPWDPSLHITHPETYVDTSMVGYPGYLTALSGQDGSPSATDGSPDPSAAVPDSSSPTAYQAILDDYDKLGTYADQLDQSVSDLVSTGVSGTAAERKDGQSTAEHTAVDISNLIDHMASLNDGDGTYADDIANLRTLGSWLRNRSDAIREAWDSSVAMATEETILGPLEQIGYSSGTDDYKTLFEENYDAWKPVEQ